MKNITRKKKKYNTNLVKARHSYTLKETAELFNLHTGTVQRWRKEGLRVIDDGSKPFLVIGEEIKRFLKEKSRKRKHPLGPGEFFCTKCKTARKSQLDKLSVEISGKTLGKIHKQVIVKGICEVCNQRLFRFSSDRKVKERQKKEPLLLEHKRTIIGSEDSPLNAYITRGGNNED